MLQNLYDLGDEATVAEAIDSRAFLEFCGVDSSNQVPDGDTLGCFRNLLIRNGLQEKLFTQVVGALMERTLILKKGTIVDSTIISAFSSTRNRKKKRDLEAHQVKKREYLALWVQGAYRRGQEQRAGSHGRGHGGKRSRRHPSAQAADRRGRGCLWRQRLSGGRQARGCQSQE